MTQDWKPPTATQIVIGQMVLQGWTKEKIMNWWKARFQYQYNKGDMEKLLEWIDRSIEDKVEN